MDVETADPGHVRLAGPGEAGPHSVPIHRKTASSIRRFCPKLSLQVNTRPEAAQKAYFKTSICKKGSLTVLLRRVFACSHIPKSPQVTAGQAQGKRCSPRRASRRNDLCGKLLRFPDGPLAQLVEQLTLNQ